MSLEFATLSDKRCLTICVAMEYGFLMTLESLIVLSCTEHHSHAAMLVNLGHVLGSSFSENIPCSLMKLNMQSTENGECFRCARLSNCTVEIVCTISVFIWKHQMSSMSFNGQAIQNGAPSDSMATPQTQTVQYHTKHELTQLWPDDKDSVICKHNCGLSL